MFTSSLQPGLAFDAGELFGSPTTGPLPTALPGEIVLRVPEGLSPLSLRDICEQLFCKQNWYDRYSWSTEDLSSGIYRLRLPIPDSNSKTFDEQKALLLAGAEIAPLVLVELALLCLKKAGQPDPLQNGWVRCKELCGRRRVVLRWSYGRLRVYYSYWEGRRCGSVWLASARRVS